MGITKKVNFDVSVLRKKKRGRPPKNIKYIDRVVTMDYIKKVEELKLDGNISENWRVFYQNFKIFETAIELCKKPEAVRIAIFLNAVGSEAIEVYNSFALSEEDKADYKKVIESFEAFCKPKKNEVYEAFLFNTRNQTPSEPFDNFLMDVKKMVKKCGFAEEDRMLRDRIVLGVRDKRLQKKLLEIDDLTVSRAIELSRAAEATEKQMVSMRGQSTSLDAIKADYHQQKYNKNQTNLSRSDKNKNSTQTTSKTNNNNSIFREQKRYLGSNPVKGDCKFCAKVHPRGKCPAYGKQCTHCKKLNHFAVTCKNKRVSEIKLNSVSDAEEEETFQISEVINFENDNSWYEKIKIGSNIVRFKLDSGASVNILPWKYIHNINSVEIKPRLANLEAYNGTKIKTIGVVQLKCIVNNTISEEEFYVTQDEVNETPILGLNSCIKLGLIKRVGVIETAQDLIKTYHKNFDGLGCCYRNFRIELKNNVIPISRPSRRIPLSLRDPLKKELDRLIQKGIIEQATESSEWISNIVIVEKQNRQIRICLDPKALNESIKDNFYEIPSFENIKASLVNKKLFSIFDLKDGFFQIELDENSRKLCTFSTPFGCYRYKRLPFGLKIAPEVFQRINECNFGDIPNVIIYIDDILIATETEYEHDETIKMLIERAKKKNVVFNKEKIQYKVREIKYLGHIISGDGIRFDPKRMQAIEDLGVPKDKKDLQKLLGFINYIRDYLPNLAEVSTPLRNLLKNKVEYQWLGIHTKALEAIKNIIRSAPTLQAFDTNKEITLQTDASKSGIGCVLIQNNKPVCFASRSLSPAEINYAQVEKEFLGIVFACSKFHNYIYGRKINVLTDHKPLIGIMTKEYYKIPSSRLQRMKLRLEKYDIHLKYLPGKKLILADLLSRNFKTNDEEIEIKELNELVHTINVTNSKLEEFKLETDRDPVLKNLKTVILNGWPTYKKYLPENLKFFWKLKDELYLEGHLIYLNNRIFVPQSLRESILKNLHLSHLGIEKTKQRARSLVYWPNLNTEIEEMITRCATCQKHRKGNIKEPLINHEIPDSPYKKLGIDIMEVLGKTYLVVGDYFSKYMDVIPLNKKNAETVISKLQDLFATHGIPVTIVADNMPFNSYVFLNFAKELDIEIKTSSPHYPKSNGFAERLVQVAKNMIKKCQETNTSFWKALLEYRNTPIKNSNYAPTELLMNRQTRSLIPGKEKIFKTDSNKSLLPTILNNNRLNKRYYDKTAKIRADFKEGDEIWLRTKNKEWIPGRIYAKLEAPRSYEIELNNGQIIRRNSSFMRRRNG